VVAAFSARPEPPPPRVTVSVDRPTREVTIRGLDLEMLARGRQLEIAQDRWRALCPIGVRPDREVSTKELVPLPGAYRIEGQTLRFRARYPLDQAGYRVVIDERLLTRDQRRVRSERSETGPLVIDVEIADTSASQKGATVVSAIKPSGEMLLENLLRFYVHFSAPMSRGEAYRRIRLLDALGHPVSDAFLELDEELWSADGRRFTLLFDPGRIKRGLRPREELGPALREGGVFALVVDRDWPDATGRPLAAGFRKPFRVGPADMSPPSPRDWTIRPPAAGTKDDLVLGFPEPLDDALARRLITVKGPRGELVRGQVRLESAETRWCLTPDAPWLPGEYQLVIGVELEDLAGNSVGRPFEVDSTGPISEHVTSETVSLSFQVRRTAR
jgi:hypothetical protein